MWLGLNGLKHCPNQYNDKNACRLTQTLSQDQEGKLGDSAACDSAACDSASAAAAYNCNAADRRSHAVETLVRKVRGLYTRVPDCAECAQVRLMIPVHQNRVEYIYMCEERIEEHIRDTSVLISC